MSGDFAMLHEMIACHNAALQMGAAGGRAQGRDEVLAEIRAKVMGLPRHAVETVYVRIDDVLALLTGATSHSA